MHAWIRTHATRAAVLLVFGWGFGAGAQAAAIDPGLAAELAARAPQDEIAVIVSLADKVDRRLYKLADRSQRDTRLVKALKEEIGIPVHFHTHDTSGIAAASVLAAIDAGCDAVDGALDAPDIVVGATVGMHRGKADEAIGMGFYKVSGLLIGEI